MLGAPPLNSFRVRPRFRARVAAEPGLAQQRVLDALADLPEGVELRPFPGLVGLHITDELRHTWSPRLLLHFEPQADGSTIIEGVYGPEAEVWSIFLYGYFLTGMLGIFSLILGCAQVFVASTPWAFWVTGALAGLAAALYLAAQLGQKLGAWQTFQLHQAWAGASAQAGLVPA